MHIKQTITALAASAILMTVAACGSSGGSGGTVSTFEPRYAYVLNEDDPSVSWYLINEQTGDPRHLGYLYLGDEADSVHDMVLHPDGTALYVSDPDGEAIHTLAVNTTTGSLSHQGSTVQERSVWDMEIAPDGAFIIVAQGPGDPAHENPERYAVLGINDQTVPMPEAVLIDEVSFDFVPPNEGRKFLAPDGRMLFHGSLYQIASLPVDPDGGLNLDDMVITTQNPEITSVATDPDGQHLYAVARAGEMPGNILVYEINGDGSLTLVDGAAADSGNQDRVFASAKSGEFYALSDSGVITAATFDPDTGTVAIAELGDAADPARTNVAWAAADPSGQFLYTATSGSDDGESLGVTNIEDLEASTYTPRFGSIARGGPSRIVFATGNPVTTTALRLFVGDASGDSDAIEHFAINANTTLGDRQTYQTGSNGITQLALIPGKNVLLSAHQGDLTGGGLDGQGQVVRLDPETGTPSATSANANTNLASNVMGLGAETSGRFAYAAVQPDDSDRALQAIRYAEDTNTFTTFNNVSIGVAENRGLAVEPAGRYIFVDRSDLTSIGTREINASDGLVTFTNGLDYDYEGTLHSLAVTPDGAFLTAVTDDAGSGELVTMSISPVDGVLAQVSSQALAGAGVALAIHPSGEWIYAISRDDDENENHLEVFSLTEDGALSAEPVFTDTTTSAANAYASVIIHPLGTALYVATETTSQEGYIQRFEIDADDGGLVQTPTLETFSVQQPRSLAIFSTRQ